MNGIQKYFVAIANESIREAAGHLIASGKLDPDLIVDSMKELIEFLPSLESKVSCNLDFTGGYGHKKQRLMDSTIDPTFIQPS